MKRQRPLLLILFTVVQMVGCGGGGDGSITLTTGEQGGDPVVVEVPVAYVSRPLPDDPPDLRSPLDFHPGARLFVRPRASTAADDIEVSNRIAAIVAAEEGVTAQEIALDIKDLESSFDGSTLIFAVRAVPEPVAENLEDTTWNLWTYDLAQDLPAYLIGSRIKRNEGVESGGGHDLAPHFLPDDRIVFSSTRQVASQGRQLNEGRIQLFAALDEDRRDPAAVLHVYDPQLRDEEFRQISFNLSHDLDPIVLSSGEIVFSRWNNTATDHISLYRIRPSGLELSPLYGFHSQNSGTDGSRITYSQPRELDDGRLVSIVRPFASTTLGGNILLLDTAGFSDAEQSIAQAFAEGGAGQEALTETDIRTDNLLSRGGQFASVYALRDGTGRLLVSWADCRVVDAEAVDIESARLLPCTLQPENENAAPPLYGAWVYNPTEDTQRPVVIPVEGRWVSEIIAAEPRDFPALLSQPALYSSELAQQGEGRLLIDSVYDVDGADASVSGIAAHARPGSVAYEERPARFLRVVQPVPIPDREIFDIPAYAAGVSGGAGFREILGYVPVEPDGSVSLVLPANRPLSFEVLDERGRRIGAAHNYWLQLGAGEVLRCSGCHDGSSSAPHGRLDAQPTTSNPGAVSLSSGALGFPGTRSAELFATEAGQSMAQVWNLHRPVANAAQADRTLSLAPQYTDEWHAPELTGSATIDDRGYPADWTDIPPERPIVVANFDPEQPSRIVINYIDHIQPIFERVRDARLNAEAVAVDTCVGCHQSAGSTAVPAGQLDLTDGASDIDPDHYISYRELLSQDQEQWLSTEGALGDRQWICTETDDDGNLFTTTQTIAVSSPARAGSANASARFFNCFEGGVCGRPDSPALPDNCVEGDGIPDPVTRNTVDHSGLLSEPELRLLSEWLDIGAQYFNNPFDERLVD